MRGPRISKKKMVSKIGNVPIRGAKARAVGASLGRSVRYIAKKIGNHFLRFWEAHIKPIAMGSTNFAKCGICYKTKVGYLCIMQDLSMHNVHGGGLA